MLPVDTLKIVGIKNVPHKYNIFLPVNTFPDNNIAQVLHIKFQKILVV